ncbi:hypothetical protein CKO38_18045, partial [Rhodospirillum rubrum]|nr:hypothetical protein [Rhodospirillum rubrum]
AGGAGLPGSPPVLSPTATPALPPGVAASPIPAVPGGGLSPAPPPPGLAGQTLTGTVVASGGAAQPMVDTEIGRLAVSGRLGAPAGSSVVLQVVGRPLPPVTQVPPPIPPLTGSGASASGWPALAEAMALLDQNATEAEAAGNPLVASTPRPGPMLAATLTSFVGALRAGGDAAKWPGEATLRSLEKMGRRGVELANKLRADLGDMAERPTTEKPTAGEWRVHTVPFLNGATIEPVRIILRRPPTEDGEGEEAGKRRERGERFLVEVDLSRLGFLQFDGLYRRGGRMLDMVVRSREALPPTMRGDITVLFNTALVTLGLGGQVMFEAGGPFVRPPPESVAPPLAGPPGGLIA